MILRQDRGAVLHALRVTQSPSYGVEGCEWFVVEIGPDRAFEILERVNLFGTARAKDAGTLELVFSDASGRFVGDDVLYTRGIQPPEEFDICRMIVREDEVLWHASHPEVEVELFTESIGVDELRDLAGRRLVRIG
jgi:hypothetical protein